MVELVGSTVFDEMIGQAETDDLGMEIVVGHILEDSRPKSALDDTVLHRDNAATGCADLVKDFLINRLEEPHIIVCNGLPCFAEFANDTGHDISERSETEDSRPLAIGKLASTTYRKLLHRTPPIGKDATASRITDDEGTFVGQLGGVHQAAQLMLVHRRRDGEVGNGTKRSQVEGTVMGGSVLPYQSCTVETEHDVQATKRHIVDDMIVGTLSEGRVDVAERYQPLFGKSAGKGNGMTLCNSHVEGSLGHLVHHDGKAATRCHRRSDADNLVVLVRQLQQRLAKDVLEFRWQAFCFVAQTLSGLRVVLARSVENGRVLLGRLEALAFDGMQMQQLGTFHVLYLPKGIHKLDDIVPVGRTEITDVESLEDVLLTHNQRLDGVIETQYLLPPAFAEETHPHKPVRKTETDFIVKAGGVQLVQIMLHATDAAVDAHIVIIQND